MPNGSDNTVELLLKCRPTPDQLSDRLQDPRPDGLELYLDASDIASQEAMREVVRSLEVLGVRPGFCRVVEGPVRSLDGAFFHIARNSEADREVVRRVVALGREMGAAVANLHAIAPSPDAGSLSADARRVALDHAVAFLEYFARTAMDAGLTPAIENIPPVQRQRESRYFYSPLGMAPEDIMFFVRQVPGLRTVLDVSHAQLYINARRYAEKDGAQGPGGKGLRRRASSSRPSIPNAGGGAEEFVPGPHRSPADGPHCLAPELFHHLHQFQPVPDIYGYIDTLGDSILVCHLSNASGILGEGLPFAQGDMDMDQVVRALCRRARYLVTETLEPDPARAVYMRDAQRRLARVLAQERPNGAMGENLAR